MDVSGVQGLTKWTPDHNYLPPLQHVQPRGRGVQFRLSAILPRSNTPTPLFEHEYEHEHEDEHDV
jgi:hypothetical protein